VETISLVRTLYHPPGNGAAPCKPAGGVTEMMWPWAGAAGLAGTALPLGSGAASWLLGRRSNNDDGGCARARQSSASRAGAAAVASMRPMAMVHALMPAQQLAMVMPAGAHAKAFPTGPAIGHRSGTCLTRGIGDPLFVNARHLIVLGAHQRTA
jgi:hypothetical protein